MNTLWSIAYGVLPFGYLMKLTFWNRYLADTYLVIPYETISLMQLFLCETDTLWIVTLWIPYAIYLVKSLPYAFLNETTFLMYLLLQMPFAPYVTFSLWSCGNGSLWLYVTFTGLLISWCCVTFWVMLRKNSIVCCSISSPKCCRCGFHLTWLIRNNNVISIQSWM